MSTGSCSAKRGLGLGTDGQRARQGGGGGGGECMWLNACAALCVNRQFALPSFVSSSSMAAKKRPRSILQRAAAAEPRPAKKARAQQAAGSGHAPGWQQAATAAATRRKQQQGGGGGAREPAGLRAVSAVHSQAAYAVHRLLEADASKRGGVSLKSLTLGPRVTAKKVRQRRLGNSRPGSAALASLLLSCTALTHTASPLLLLLNAGHVRGDGGDAEAPADAAAAAGADAARRDERRRRPLPGPGARL